MRVMRVNKSSNPKSNLAQNLYAKRCMTKMEAMMENASEMAMYRLDLSRIGSLQAVVVRFLETAEVRLRL